MQRDEKEPLTIPKKPPDILIETLAIRSLLMFQKNPSIIYFSSIQKERAVEIIKSLLYSNPPFLYSPRRNHGSEIFHWFLYCLMNLLGVEDDKYDPYSLYFLELFQSKSTTATNFYKTIQTPIKTLIDFVNLLKFVEEYPSLYCALKPYCNLSFTKDEADDLLEKLQLPALSLFNDEIINSLDVVRIVKKTPIEIYSLPYAYTCLTFSKNYQILNTSIVIFPDTSQFIDDIILSAINTSLISQKHFADLIYKTSTTLFMSDKIEKALKAATIFPEYSDWVFTAIISRRMHDQNFLDRVLPNIQKIISKNSIFSDLVERISNDDNFYNTLKQTTGIYVEPKKYITESVPFIYRKYLINYNFDPFLSLSSQKLFIISDKNREIDNTFVCAFFVIFYIIKASETSSISNNNQLDVIIAKINETLCRIRECDRDKIIIDGFSLLFIKIRDRFIFSTNTASLIISELTSFAVSEKVMKLLKDSLKKLQITQSISNENDPQRIEDALVPIKSLVLKYLIMGDVEIAQRIAVLNPQLQLLLSDYKNLQIYRKSENYVNTLLQNENEENILSLHEIALCFHNDQEIIDRAYFYLNDSVNANSVNDKIVKNENNEINMELLKLLGERRNRIGKNLLKCVKKCKSERILKFNQILSNLSLTEWTKTKTITSKTPLFSGFVSYMNSIIPVLLETNSAKTVGEAISISHYEIITQLLKAKKFDIAEKIAKSFNTSIVDYVLSDPAIDRNYIQEILDPYPIVLITDKLMTFNKFDENDEYNQMNKYGTLKRFYLSKNKSKNIGDHKETFEYYDYSLQNGCGNSFFINSLKDLLNKNLNRSMNEKDIEILIEISYRLPSDEFVAIVESYLSKIDIISLGKTSKSLGCDFSFCEKVELLANIQLSIKEKPFPLKNSYSKLLSNREIKLAKEFLKFYRYEIDAIALTRKEILYSLHNNLPVIDLFEIIPNSRKEIIESLPIRYHSILDGFHSHFSENIPSHWKPASDPLTLLINNISDHKNVVEFLMSHSAVDFDVNFQQLLLK
ncbi:hypothetical protein TRFO_13450 [Tritrichomonas foetus]|uniref:Uncharacterized protein n=1 Tax=Tritrichomonas foetus TaxID=1144522 RepID=A0A1J4L2D8_9EUKA|nr:hypothetical protein TRFO_13450 [Tritrichomonas foetus]|eukprot:OHT16124.1 hypothetical protein TRFO_13450 [Tritrichomonas foetus]